MSFFPPMITGKRVVIDLGTSYIKVLEIESGGPAPQVLSSQIIDLNGEGLIGTEEINLHLQSLLREIGDFPVVLVIPEHITISKVIKTPRSQPEAIDIEIAEETAQLSGLGESDIAYDYYCVDSRSENTDAFWVTMAREADIEQQTARLGTSEINLAGITTPANALVSAWLVSQPDQERMVFVDIGATTTIVAVVEDRQRVFASSYPIGGEFFTRAVETALRISFDEAESMKRSDDCFADARTASALSAAVRTWLRELEKTLLEYFKDLNVIRAAFPPFWVRISGGTVLQPGFLEFLRADTAMEIETWPKLPNSTADTDLNRHAIGYGAHVHCSKYSERSAGLLPVEVRALRGRQQRLLRLNFACLATMLIMLGLVVYGTVQKLEIILEKNTQIKSTQAAAEQAESINQLLATRRSDYAAVFPVLQSQRRTSDILETFNTLRETRGEHNLWWSLLADFKSYTNSSTLNVTNAVPIDPVPPSRRVVSTNGVTRAQVPFISLIAELTIPGEEQNSLQLLSLIVEDLKSRPLFEHVDRLSTDQKINLLDSKYVLTGMTYSIKIDISDDLVAPEIVRTAGQTNAPVPGVGGNQAVFDVRRPGLQPFGRTQEPVN